MCICSAVTRSSSLKIRDAHFVNSKNHNWATAVKKGGEKSPSCIIYLNIFSINEWAKSAAKKWNFKTIC